MEKSADGNWHQIARRMYELDTLPGYKWQTTVEAPVTVVSDRDDSEEKAFII